MLWIADHGKGQKSSILCCHFYHKNKEHDKRTENRQLEQYDPENVVVRMYKK